jgi:hypothetical protein
MPPPTRLYAYVDEYGQDTDGRLFVVGVVVTGTQRDAVFQELEALEKRSGKGRVKWRRAKPAYREAYIDGLTALSSLAESLFYVQFTQGKAYIDLTAEATARAVKTKAQGLYRVSISVDGLTRTEQQVFANSLRARGIGPRKIRGVRDEKSDAGIRLADALCGLIRDAEEQQRCASAALAHLQRSGHLRQV